MRFCPDLFAQSAINYEKVPTRPTGVEAGPMPVPVLSSSSSSSSSAEPSFLASPAAMLTSTFSQTATSALTFSAPPRPSSTMSEEKMHAAGLETGIALLHDHVGFVRLNPIVTDCHAVSADSDEGRKLNVPKLLADFAATTGKPPAPAPATATATATATSPTESATLSGWTHYAVTDALPHPFGLPGTTLLKYTIALRNMPDGLESLVASPGGVTIHGDIRVVSASEGRDADDGWRERRDPKKLWLQEHADVRCWVGTAWYIRKTLGESHEAAHERVRERWETEVKRSIGGSAAAAAAAAAATAAPTSTTTS